MQELAHYTIHCLDEVAFALWRNTTSALEEYYQYCGGTFISAVCMYHQYIEGYIQLYYISSFCVGYHIV